MPAWQLHVQQPRKIELCENFKSEGWALPCRSTVFIDGEQSGKKKTPEEVHMLLRNKVQPRDYVTSQQIK